MLRDPREWLDVRVIDLTHSDRQSADVETRIDGIRGPTVYLDLDTVLLGIHQGRRGVELGLQADLGEAIGRLAEVAHPIVVLVDPPPAEIRHGLETTKRMDVLRDGLGDTVRRPDRRRLSARRAARMHMRQAGQRPDRRRR